MVPLDLAVCYKAHYGWRVMWPAGVGRELKETAGLHSEKIKSGYDARRVHEPWLLDKPVAYPAPEPQIEEPHYSHDTNGVRFPSWRPSLAGIVWLAIGFGLCIDGLAVTIARARYAEAEWLFWLAIIVPFVVFTIVLVAARPSPKLRKFTIAAVGLYPSILYRLSSPLVLSGFDEHIHEQELLNLLRGSGLFAPNPMLGVGPNYPGMELFTGVIIRLSGMPVMLAMSLVILLCRLVLVLIIYNAALTITPSRQVASLTVVFYAVSPQFYFFNSQFAYQTMALTLGLGGLLFLRRAQLTDDPPTSRRFSRVGTLALLAVVVTHHITSWIVLAFLTSWAVMAPPGKRKILFRAASVMGAAVACWTAITLHRLKSYLGPILDADRTQFKAFMAGTAQRKVFGGVAGTGVTPQWERVILVTYSLICAFAAITVGWALVSRAFRTRDHMLGLLSVLCLAFPVTLGIHFIPAAADLGDRASTFFFLPLAFSCSLVVMRDPRVVHYFSRRRRRSSTALVTLISVTSIAYLGGVMLGSGPDWEKLPGPYLVSADPRTQDAETLAAVRWAATHLPPGSRIVADRVPADLLAGEARMWPVSVPERGLEPAWLYFSPTWTPYQKAIVQGLRITYIYVDQRLADSLPHVGFYFYRGESPIPRHISTADLAKFAHVPGLTVSYHHGPVTIYDTAGLRVASKVDGFVGERTMGLGRIGDAALGIVIADLILLFRRRLSRVRSVSVSVEGLGTVMILMAVSIFAAGILFAFRAMPGPSFSVAAIMTILIVVAVERLTGRGLTPGAKLPAMDPLVVLGVLAAIFAIATSIRTAWNVDVTSVDSILREVARASRRRLSRHLRCSRSPMAALQTTWFGKLASAIQRP
jgi:hypothetical protein